MDIKCTLDAVTYLLDQIKNCSKGEQLLIYSTIKTLLDDLGEIAYRQKTPNFSQYRLEVLHGCQGICGLLNDGHDKAQHFTWAKAATTKIASVHCFNLSTKN